MIKRVNCSSCGITLEVPQRNGEPFRVFHCPNCNHQLRATFSDPQPNAQAETVYGGMKGVSLEKPSDDENLTVFPQAKSERPGTLHCGKEAYSLHLGRNLVGRKSKSSNADVQIPTDDLQMSREHVIINVMKISDGRIKALVRNYKEHVATSINGMPLNADDEVVLTNGIDLKLGNTSITYIEE